MSAHELKEILHKQIDHLRNQEDIEDLFLTVSDFLGQRQLWEEETPELSEQLERTLKSVRAGAATIPNRQIAKEAKLWITK